ncbi:unnamed protein product [Lathyrus oleraceus]
MEGRYFIGILLLHSLASLLVKCDSSSSQDKNLKTYIVYTGDILGNETYSLLRYKDLIHQETQHPNLYYATIGRVLVVLR